MAAVENNVDTSKEPEKVEVGVKCYFVQEKLGFGGFSEVYVGEDVRNAKKYALKIIFNNRERVQKVHQYKENEILNMRKVRHENIAKLYGYDLQTPFRDESCTILVQELAQNGELFSYIRQEKLGEELTRYIFLKVVRGVHALHSAGVAHRDLTLQNILLGKHFQPLVIDMQFSKTFLCKDTAVAVPMTTSLGTRNYMAPEVMFANRPGFDQGYDCRCDMWSLGVILFVLVTGTQPYRDLENDWWSTKISEGKWNRFWQAHEQRTRYSTKFKALVQQLLCWNPEERITTHALMDDKEGWIFDAKMRSKDYKKQMKRRQARLKKQTVKRPPPVPQQMNYVQQGMHQGQWMASPAPGNHPAVCTPHQFQGHQQFYASQNQQGYHPQPASQNYASPNTANSNYTPYNTVSPDGSPPNQMPPPYANQNGYNQYNMPMQGAYQGYPQPQPTEHPQCGPTQSPSPNPNIMPNPYAQGPNISPNHGPNAIHQGPNMSPNTMNAWKAEQQTIERTDQSMENPV